MNRQEIKTVCYQTVGCRLNQYETERMAARLLPYGLRRVGGREAADLYVINTCTVTHRADSDSRYLVRRAARQNPQGRIVVVGCYVESGAARLASMDGVDVIIGNHEKDNIDTILRQRLPELFGREPSRSRSVAVTGFYERNRAWIKISDGCSQHCSFCIVTLVRGELVNLPARAVLDEIKSLVDGGYREVVLTGVNIGDYRDGSARSAAHDLAGLCRRIMRETDLCRIRLSSIEPQSVSSGLVELYAESAGRICRHFHLPLQSGSPRILKLMRRPYTPDQFLQTAAVLKRSVPDTIIGADVIVGFPGETDQDFEMTRGLCRSGLIDYLHVFSYSDRPGTAAAEMSGKIASNAIRERNAVLTQLSRELRLKSHQRQLGKRLEVISEHRCAGDGSYWGISDNYLRVKLPGTRVWGRDIVSFEATAAHGDYLEGRVITS